MTLATAKHHAAKILTWLAPHAERLMIAGSIRRDRPECADVDIVCIPKVTEHTDLLGATTARDNHVLQFLQDYVKERNPSASPARTPRFQSGGEKEGKQLILLLPGGKSHSPTHSPTHSPLQLDLWFATQENFATRLLQRTGSREHNIWLAARLGDRGLHWFPYEGIASLEDLRKAQITPGEPGAADRARAAGLIKPDVIEQDLYRRAGLQFIEPANREPQWLAKIDSGL